MVKQFWASTWEWPRDPAGRIFLGRAVYRVGRAVFGDVWNDDDATVEIDASQFDQSTGRFRESDSLDKFRRAAHAAMLITKWATEGEIKGFVRLPDRIDMAALPMDWWAAMAPHSVYSHCQMDPAAPLSETDTGRRHGWVFLDRADLDACMSARFGQLSPATTTVAAAASAPNPGEWGADPPERASTPESNPIETEPACGAEGSTALPVLKTGLAGRPTAKFLLLAEMRRRAEVGDLLPKIGSEAKALSDWLALSNVGVTAAPKTITNSLRDEYKALRAEFRATK